MHDIRAIRDDPALFDQAMARRAVSPVASAIAATDSERRAALTTLGERQARRNALAKQIGQLRRTGADTAALEAEATTLRDDDMAALETRAAAAEADIDARLASLPNILDPDVPDGRDETANIEQKTTRHPCRPRRRPAAFRAGRSARPDGLRRRHQARRVPLHRPARPPRPHGTRPRPVDDRSPCRRARLRGNRRPPPGERRHRLWLQPAAEVHRRHVPHHRRPLAHPHRRGPPSPTWSPARSSPKPAFPSAWSP